MSSDARNPPPAQPVGIKDIARALGISTGTVHRALHAKPGVNAMTRARVLSMADSLGYRPNLAARYLKSRKQLRISVHLPRKIALFWESVREGIRGAAALQTEPAGGDPQQQRRLLLPLRRADLPHRLRTGDHPLLERARVAH